MANKANGVLLKIGIALAAVVFAAGGFYILTDYRLDAVEKDVIKVEGNVGKVEENVKKSIGKVEGDVKKDIEVIKENIEKGDAEFDIVEDAVSIIQYDLRYIKDELFEQKNLAKERHEEVLRKIDSRKIGSL